MKPPALNRRLVLEDKIATPDGHGGRSVEWSTVGTLWAEVLPRTGREVNGEAGAQSLTGFRVTVRAAAPGHSGRPVAGQRLRMGERLLMIKSVTEATWLDQYLTCIAEEELSL